MTDMTKINAINQVVDAFFKENPSVQEIAAKELMPQMIKAGIFKQNYQDGLPLRKVFRELDDEESLHLIPRLHAERKNVNTYWYFSR